ncbi:hypothetical protein ABEP13_04290 [Geobacillus stearothermophilus]|uniref:hypothetical protein n=1 Tax=Geobacillus stearothermophilus TaxID=1422 RepID=UPI003D2253C2
MGHFSEEKQGVLYTAASYLLWGVLPLYWKLLEARPALEILAHRIIWSFTFMIILLAATAVPLLYFAKGAKRVSMTMLGFLQYISPTISLLLGVFLFGEPFTRAHLYAFSCIWTALIVFSVVQIKQAPGQKKWKRSSLKA